MGRPLSGGMVPSRGTLDPYMWFDALFLVTITSNGKGVKQ